MGSWNDFNDAQSNTNLIPKGTLAKVRLTNKTAMLEGGEWRATATAADPTTVGYHLSALYSPIGWLSWERIVRSWEIDGAGRVNRPQAAPQGKRQSDWLGRRGGWF